MTHKEKTRLINIIGAIILLVLLYVGVFEAKNTNEKINMYKPDVVYEMTNKHISWD